MTNNAILDEETLQKMQVCLKKYLPGKTGRTG